MTCVQLFNQKLWGYFQKPFKNQRVSAVNAKSQFQLMSTKSKLWVEKSSIDNWKYFWKYLNFNFSDEGTSTDVEFTQPYPCRKVMLAHTAEGEVLHRGTLALHFCHVESIYRDHVVYTESGTPNVDKLTLWKPEINSFRLLLNKMHDLYSN